MTNTLDIITDDEIRDVAFRAVAWSRKMAQERKEIISAATGYHWVDMERAFGRFRYAHAQYTKQWKTAARRGYFDEEHDATWNAALDEAKESAS
jgi:hypothetical protein